MFKFAHKITSYGDESRIDFNLSKIKLNFQFKDKVLYLKDETVLLKKKNRYWYKFLYVMNNKYIYDYKIGDLILKNNILHRKGGLPAKIYANGNKSWYLNGILHREGGLPAVIESNGNKEWYLNGTLDREGGLPAIIYANGNQIWIFNGVPHRDGGLPAKVYSNGTKIWYLNGTLHREGGLPAVIRSDGYQEYWRNGVKYDP